VDISPCALSRQPYSICAAIVAAYYIGTSLFPEAKTYRLIADILNDLAITLDVVSPVLNAVALPFLLRTGSLRIVALCLSGSLRSLCSIAAGGSKTAVSSHFATPLTGRGDLGDLNAKESSLETVLCLVGMLVSPMSRVQCVEGLNGASARDFDHPVLDDSMVDVHCPLHPSHHPSCGKLHRRSWNCIPYAQSAANTDCLDNIQAIRQLNNQSRTASHCRANFRVARGSSRCTHGKIHRSLRYRIIPLRHLTQTYTAQFISTFRVRTICFVVW
jgi:hypothetical protein